MEQAQNRMLNSHMPYVHKLFQLDNFRRKMVEVSSLTNEVTADEA